MTSTMQILQARVPSEGGMKQAAIIEITNAPAAIRALISQLGFAPANDRPTADVQRRTFVATGDMVALLAAFDATRQALAPYYGGDARLTRSEYTAQ